MIFFFFFVSRRKYKRPSCFRLFMGLQRSAQVAVMSLPVAIMTPVCSLPSVSPQQMRRTGNKDENKRILMDLDVVLKSHDCPYIIQCYGAIVTNVRLSNMSLFGDESDRAHSPSPGTQT